MGLDCVVFFFVLCVAVIKCENGRYDGCSEENEFCYKNQPVKAGTPWPMPQSYVTSEKYQIIDGSVFIFSPEEFNCNILEHAINRYHKIIFSGRRKKLKFIPKQIKELEYLSIILQNPCEKYPSIDSDESYSLTIDDTASSLKAKSIWGILRGLETFSQLVHNLNGQLVVNYTWINDYPRFPWRGVLLDTSRHFLPVQTILNSLDAMAFNKINVFHWHIVDDHSFPYESYTFPRLSLKGAYRPYTHVYSQEDVSRIIEYARMRGIRVVVEFDTPGHTRSWGYGVPELLTECYTTGGKPSGTYGPVDPSKNSSYDFMKAFFTEISEVFPDDYLHLGGDEVYFDCWKSNPKITEFMKELKIEGDYEKLESYYIQKLLDIISDRKKNYIVWQEVFDNKVQVKRDTVVHVWKGGHVEELAKVTSAGLKVILSSPWYLDYVGYGAIWKNYYSADPQNFNGTAQQKSLVMGGEACLWAEFVDSTNVHSRLWPSASAVAERLWSSESVRDVEAARVRLEEHRCRMLARGILAEPPSGPGFCEIEVAL